MTRSLEESFYLKFSRGQSGELSWGMCRFLSICSNVALSVYEAEVFLCSRKFSSYVFLHITFVMICSGAFYRNTS